MNGKCVPSPSDATVFIVEDERVARRAMQVLLNASGFRATAYESAEEALDELRRGTTPAFVLVDVDLPGMSGLELIPQLEAMLLGSIIILTTACDEKRIDPFLRRRGVHYVRKPVDVTRLLELLRAEPSN